MKTIYSTIRISVIQIVLMLFVLHITAQNTCTEIMPNIPPSPQAVAFNRLGDYQVNNNYGAPDINIPLFEIDFHGYKIPLALHYEASPLKPGYNYDVTGLEWTLSGNSCVSRTIKDRADEYGRFNNPFALDSFYDHSGHLKRYMDYANELDWMNFQYDSYNIVLPSGRSIPFFMYKENGTMTYKLLNSDSNVQIVCSYGSNSINSFTVKDENGVTYSFTLADQISNRFDNDVNANRNVTWLLTSIDIPSKGTIIYNYTSLQTINTSTVSEPVIRVSRLIQDPEVTEEEGINVAKTLQTQSPRYRMRFLSSISYGPSRVDFDYMPDGIHMKEIVVSDCNSTVRKYAFTINNSALTKLVISSQDGDDRLVYGFTYTNNNPGNYTDYWGNRCNSSTYPNLTTDLGNFNMYFDYIGIDTTDFKNRLQNDGSPARFIPRKPADLSYYCKIKLQSTTNGDTRQPTSPQFHGVLSSITYPNGGQTVFTYENHRFLTATAADGDFIFDRRSQRIIEGGGFRIESVKNYTADGTIASEDHYRYGFTYGEIVQQDFPLPLPATYGMSNHIGCGEAVVDPNLLTFMSYSHATAIDTNQNPLEFQKMALGMPSAFSNITNVQGRPTWWDAYLSANTFRAHLGGRRPVVYPEITVYHGNPNDPDECHSKTVYRYDIYSYQLSPQNHYLSSFQQTALPDTSYFEPLYYYNGQGMRCMENPARRHQLKSKSEYSYDSVNGTWDLVSEETYTYSEESVSQSGYIFDSVVSRGHCSYHTLQMGAGMSLEDFSLFGFYKDAFQIFGRSTICEKYATTLRKGGTRTWENTRVETYSYLYPGVLKSRIYTDVYDNQDLYSYVGEVNGNSSSVIAAMKTKNMMASLLYAETNSDYDGNGPVIISGSKIDYDYFGDDILPFKLYERNGNVYEGSMEIISYDSHGNPTETQDLKTGIYTVFLWDTYGRYLLAMVKNATWTQIQSHVSQLMTGTSQSRYSTLKTLLPDTQIQTWDYIPLVGVSSHTDVNGQTFLYEYDGLGRLKREKRVVNGTTNTETLREYEYNFMNPSL